MALQGTMKDFALPDIFQLIGMQRKTGVLTLENVDDSVTIKFLDGQVVGADTKSATLEDRLGELLVRQGRITQAQLEEALQIQQNTLQRLGHILVQAGRISEDELVDALRVQSSQVIYRLFRWTEGRYHFDPVSDVDYDQAHFQPISSETILMEGARMIDEWPIIERRIKSDRMVLTKTESALGLDVADNSILEDDIDFNLGMLGGEEASAAPAAQADPGIKLSSEEGAVMTLVDGKRTVAEICDLSTLGEFDTCRVLSDMLTRNLVEPVQQQATRAEPASGVDLTGRVLPLLGTIGLAVAVGLSVMVLPSNPLTPWRMLSRSAATQQLRLYTSMARLEKIEKAIQVFYLDAGTFPRNTAVLAQNGYLEPEDLQDPWGRPYQFQISPGGYRLSGLGPEGEERSSLVVARQFNAVQQMMMQGDEAPPP